MTHSSDCSVHNEPAYTNGLCDCKTRLFINPLEFEHLKDESSYNHNFYQHKERSYKLLEVCHEDYNYYSIYMVLNDVEIFLGDCDNGFEGGRDLEITLFEHFT